MRLLLIWLLLCGSLASEAQLFPTVSMKLNQLEKVRISDSGEVHSPRKAAIMSAIIPGAGQLYNEKYWKIGVIYTGAGLLTWYFIKNRDSLDSYQKAYTARIDTFTSSVDTKYLYLTDAAVLRNRDFHRRQRDIAILGFFGLYALQIIDANVDAHLREFEINKDLSLKISPDFSTLLAPQRQMSLLFTFKF